MTMEGMFPNVAVCPSCASPTRPGEMFCATCGARVTAASVTAVPPVAAVPLPPAAPAHLLPATKRTHGDRSRLYLMVAGAVVVALVVGLLGANDAGAHGQ